MKKLLSLVLAAALLLSCLSLLVSCGGELEYTLLPDGTYGVSARRPERLTDVTIPEEHKGVAVTALLPSAFAGAPLAEVTIPESITTIGSGAFSDCTALVSISLPLGLTSLGDGIFDGCTSLLYKRHEGLYYLGNAEHPYLYLAGAEDRDLTSLTPHGDTRHIAAFAFDGCTSLAEVTLPSGLKTVGSNAFWRCPAIDSVRIDDLSAFLGIAFATASANPLSGGAALVLCGTELTSLAIPEGTRRILPYAFCGAERLSSVTLPSSLVSLGASAFEGCSGLVDLTLPASLTEIGAAAFRYCAGLTLLTVPVSVMQIGAEAFFGCEALDEVTFLSYKEWYANGRPLDYYDVKDKETAAGYLTGAFVGSTWVRRE